MKQKLINALTKNIKRMKKDLMYAKSNITIDTLSVQLKDMIEVRTELRQQLQMEANLNRVFAS